LADPAISGADRERESRVARAGRRSGPAVHPHRRARDAAARNPPEPVKHSPPFRAGRTGPIRAAEPGAASRFRNRIGRSSYLLPHRFAENRPPLFGTMLQWRGRRKGGISFPMKGTPTV
jgi:hypothetical protein